MNHTKQNIEILAAKRKNIADFIAASWPTAWADILKNCDVSKNSMPRILQTLQDEKLICCIGTAQDAGRRDLRPDCKIYAPYGTETLAHVPAAREKPAKYKGAKTPKHYHDWRTPEMTIHDYDIYQSRNLAMLAR